MYSYRNITSHSLTDRDYFTDDRDLYIIKAKK